MQDDIRTKLDAAKFRIEVAHRLGFNDLGLSFTPETLDDAMPCRYGPKDWDVNASTEDNVVRHHLCMTTPKTRP